MTDCGTCVPPGPSNRATGAPSCSIERAGNRARSASTSSGGMESSRGGSMGRAIVAREPPGTDRCTVNNHRDAVGCADDHRARRAWRDGPRPRRPAPRRVAGVPARTRPAAAAARRGAAGGARPVARRVRRPPPARPRARSTPPDERPRGARAAVPERDHATRRPARGVRHGGPLGVRHGRARRGSCPHVRGPRPAPRRLANAPRRRRALLPGAGQRCGPPGDGAGGERHHRRPGPVGRRRRSLVRRGGRLTPDAPASPSSSPSSPGQADGRVFAGTSGFAYPAWAPRFYPPALRSGDLLAHYASRLPAVELNNTFYARPTPAKVTAWVAATPPGFRFVVKAQRGAAVRSLFGDAATSIPWLTEALPGFGERLGAVLFRVDAKSARDDGRLAGVLAAWPAGIPLVVEAQHPSWHVDETFAALRSAGAVLGTTDTDDEEHPPD